MSQPFRPDDEIVSAVLDGEATPEERARVAADPVLAARLAEFEAVAGAVSAPVEPLGAARRDAAIAAAVAESDRRDDVVTDLRPRRRPVPFLAAAAAVLLAVVGLGVLVSRGGDDLGGDDSADGSADVGALTTDEAGEPESAGADDPTAFEAADELGDLGPLADADATREALVATGALTRSADSGDEAAAPGTGTQNDLDSATDGEAVPGDSVECQVRLEESDPELSGLLARATATYQGTPAVVLVYATVDGTQQVEVVDAGTCALLASLPL